ncbi:SDR family oxidoreductase [Sphingomonas crusticola]|uniref:SDR family oxidoreductase n=1 Tax=Sphingomonas crusticola TaxID=1697973 RepID=UPI000E269EC4|nr:SDR family oxidoreductase [Sphingomonas crusticola]
MRVFLTGATGFIGSHILPQLLDAGHKVLGLTRSDEGARALEEAGAQTHLGTLEDLDSLRRGAAQADAVMHTAFDHDFSRFAENCEKDRRVIEAIGAVLAGSARPFIITSGVGLGSVGAGQLAIEQAVDWHHPNPRVASEQAGAAALEKGASVAVVRLPQVHDTKKQGLITPFIELSRAKRMSAYIGEGANRFAAAHVTDVARLYRLALEHHEPGARYHAVAEEGVPLRQIAEAVGAGLEVPVVSLSSEQAADHFGWLAMFAGLDLAASSSWTRERLGWQPTGPGLIADLERMDYRIADAG